MTVRKTLLFMAYATVVIGVLFLVLGKPKGPEYTLFWREAINFGHVPLFGLVSLALLGIVSTLFDGGLARERHYVIALSWAVFLGGTSELLQVYIDRDPDLWDLVRNLAGAISALALVATVDRNFGERGPWKRKSLKWFLRAVASMILLVALLPMAIGFEVYRQQQQRLPYLFRFDSVFELPFIRPRNAFIELQAPPPDWAISERSKVGRIAYQVARYPTVLLMEIHPNWEPFLYLELDVYLEGEHDVKVVVRIADVHKPLDRRQRYNEAFDLKPGPNHLRIPLSDVRAAPESREMDMSNIHSVMIFFRKPERTVILYLADLKLSVE